MLHVAVGVIRNQKGEVLIAKRGEHRHQGGLWEFPGGKIEAGEGVEEALKRELFEELGITINKISPLIKTAHHYSDRHVLLDVWQVESFSGEAFGKEQQPILWVSPEALKNYAFPAANRAIRLAVELPLLYAILDVNEGDDETEVMSRLARIMGSGCQLLQLRAKSFNRRAFLALAKVVKVQCQKEGVSLLLNATAEWVLAADVEGLHLSSQQLNMLSSRPLDDSFLIAASCHNLSELEHACNIGVDFVLLSPVLNTASHPEASPLGWPRFKQLVSRCNVPVYGLGGMHREDLERAKQLGAQGVAGISLFQR